MAALTSITGLLPRVRMRCPEPKVEDNIALGVLRTVIRQFAMRTTIWRKTIPITTVADQDNYTLTPTSGTKVNHIHRVVQLNDDDAEMTDHPDTAYYLDIENQKIIFETGYVPNEAGDTINVIVSLRPEWQATNSVFPEWILDRWGDGLAGGAAVEILLNHPWNTKASAAALDRSRREFNGAIIDAKRYIEHQGTTRSTGITPV